MAKVEIQNLRKSYGPVGVIHGLDLSIREGEFVSLIGASGCGKSTLLRMIAGLEEVTSGTIALDGRVINDVAPKDRDIAMVFQNYALYPHLTVAENMGFSLRLRNASKEEIRAAVERTADLVGLRPYLGRLPKELSGGQRQRVAMGRAIVRRPRLFLFDEPLSNLDAKLRVQMRVEIKSLQRQLGTTSIYVTHDQMEAMTMSDRIVILDGGRVEQAGAPLDVYERPANLFVATFIGSPAMNLLPGRIGREGEAVYAEIGETRIMLDGQVGAASGTSIVCGIRPEQFAPPRSVPTAGHLPFTVDLLEPTGPELHVYGRLAGRTAVIAASARSKLAAGETIFVAPSPGAIHLFDGEGGRRIDLAGPAGDALPACYTNGLDG